VSETRQPTHELIAAVRGLRYDALTAEAREVARQCVLDCLGVAVAGAREPLVSILVDVLVKPERANVAGLIARQERATAPTAALVNGAAAHALDFDDTHTAMMGHPTVPVLPALLALGEIEAVSGEALLTALVAGIEFECRLAALLGPRHYEVGFHSTATLGTFGAAAACAHLLGLNEASWMHAIGIAASQASGLKASFGTMTKPFHAGHAASAGLIAALLARAGFTSGANIVEASQGFATTHGADRLDGAALDRLAGRFLIRQTLFKYHAACYLTHAAIDAAHTLRDREKIDADDVESVELTVAPALLGVCNIAEPKTGLEGKFSLRATTAMALLGVDTARLDTYTDARMVDGPLVRLRDRVRVVTEPGLSSTRVRVAIRAAGRAAVAEADSGTPAADLSEQRRRLQAKFAALVEPVLGARRCAELAKAALGIDEAPSAAALLPLTRPGGS
jgi:2-methylcitrate dehydratase PrpD